MKTIKLSLQNIQTNKKRIIVLDVTDNVANNIAKVKKSINKNIKHFIKTDNITDSINPIKDYTKSFIINNNISKLDICHYLKILNNPFYDSIWTINPNDENFIDKLNALFNIHDNYPYLHLLNDYLNNPFDYKIKSIIIKKIAQL
jgi:homospermidine synthase